MSGLCPAQALGFVSSTENKSKSRGGGRSAFSKSPKTVRAHKGLRSHASAVTKRSSSVGFFKRFSAPLISLRIAARSWLVAEGTRRTLRWVCRLRSRLGHHTACLLLPIFFTPDSKHPEFIHPQSQEVILELIKGPLRVGSPVLWFSRV